MEQGSESFLIQSEIEGIIFVFHNSSADPAERSCPFILYSKLAPYCPSLRYAYV